MSGTRQARVDDAAAIAAIVVETWQATYAGIRLVIWLFAP
jgi:hypothetical protein